VPERRKNRKLQAASKKYGNVTKNDSRKRGRKGTAKMTIRPVQKRVKENALPLRGGSLQILFKIGSNARLEPVSAHAPAGDSGNMFLT